MVSVFRRLFGFFHARPSRQVTGARGEAAAARFLKNKGYGIVARNWRSPKDRRDEIDLVARDGEVLVFVEVKTRAAGALVSGYHTVDARKKKVLRRAASEYMRGLRAAERPRTFRCDIVEVASGRDGEDEVRHFENVPLFGKHCVEL